MLLLFGMTFLLSLPAPTEAPANPGVQPILEALRENQFGQAAEMLAKRGDALSDGEQTEFEVFLQQHSPQGDWIPFLAALAERSRSNPEFLFFLSQALWRSGDVDGAIHASGKAIQAAPHDPNVIYKCAAIARTLGELEIAKQRIAASLAIQANHANSLFLLGSIHAEEGQDREARLTLQSVLAIDPNHIRALYELGKLEIRLGLHEQAAAHLQKATDMYPFFREAYSALRTPLSRLGRNGEFERTQRLLKHMQRWNPNQYRQLRYMHENPFLINAEMKTALIRELIAVERFSQAKAYLLQLQKRSLADDGMIMALAQLHYSDHEFAKCLSALGGVRDPAIQASETYIGTKGWALLGIGAFKQSRALYEEHKTHFADSNNFLALGAALHEKESGMKPETKPAQLENAAGFQFADATQKSGLNAFQHRMGHQDKRWIIDAMGSGVAVGDYDNDGDDDIYFVNGRPRLDDADPKWKNRLFRNDNGVFFDATDHAGVGDNGWGMCAVFGDVNNDGWLDLFVGNYGANVFYRNNGDGTFSEQTANAGLAHHGYAAAAAFGDLDSDGHLDLFVGNYVDFDPQRDGGLRDNFHGMEVMNGPLGLKHQKDLLYRNNGDGAFSEVSSKSGVNISEGRAMGATLADLDLDGDLDLYVSNDSTYNHVLMNHGDGTFDDASFFSGAAVNEAGREGASMGVATGDYNNDGYPDIYVTAYEQESDVFFLNKGGEQFIDMKGPLKFAAPSRWLTTWGTGFCDFDADGFLDVYTVNGHTYPQVEELNNNRAYAQGVSFYRNRSGNLFQASNAAFGGIETIAGRGSAILDYDNDGDMDIVINCMDDAPRLLENRTAQGNWLKVKLLGASAQTFGARVVVKSGGQQWTRTVDGGSSYLSQNSQTLHFGLGKAGTIDSIEAHWIGKPKSTLLSIEPNQTIQIK